MGHNSRERRVSGSRIGLLFRFFLYPLTLLLATPLRLLQGLANSLHLISAKREEYAHFNAPLAFNALFYWNVSLNLQRVGRRGVSTTLGLGSQEMSRFFHLNKPSLYLYHRFGPGFLLISMVLWWASQWVWWDVVPGTFTTATLLLALVGTTFYFNLFGFQNYHAFGWAFFPLSLFFLYHHQYGLLAATWLLSGLGGVTFVVFAGALALVEAWSEWTIWPLVAVIPAGIIYLLNMLPMFGGENAKSTIATVLAMIGFGEKGSVRYKRGMRFTRYSLYALLLFGHFPVVAWFMTGSIPWFYLMGYLLLAANLLRFRFADQWHFPLLLLTLAVPEVILSGEPWLLVSFWLVSAPFPMYYGFQMGLPLWDFPPAFRPFRIRDYTEQTDTFLSPVDPGSRVMVAFDNPEGRYFQVFDGFRHILETLLYSGSKHGIHVIPDWYFVADTNAEDASDCWGRGIDKVRENQKKWCADYVVVYQLDEPDLESKWREAGYDLVSELDWAPFAGELSPHYWFDKTVSLKWFLLKKSSRAS
jgi:hypothetical protein